MTLDDLARRGLPISTAIHEAGHAIAADYFSLGLLCATVVPRDDYRGCIFYSRKQPWEKVIVMLYAGGVAQSLYEVGDVIDLYSADVDHRLAMELARANSSNPDDRLRLLKAEAEDFVRRHRRAIRSFAIALAGQGELENEPLRAALDAAKKEI